VSEAQHTYARTRATLARVGVRLGIVLGLVLTVGCYAATSAIAAPITVTGTVVEDEAGTAWSECDGSTANVVIAVEATTVAGACNAGTGAYSIDVTASSPRQMVVAYVDDASAPGDRGVAYTEAIDDLAPISGLTIVLDAARIRSESGWPVAASRIGAYDASDDAAIPVDWNGSALDASGVELHVGSGTTFVSEGDVTVGALDVRGTYVGATGETLELRGGGTGACSGGPTSQRPLCVSGGTFVAGRMGLTDFAATSSADRSIEGANYEDLQLRTTTATPTMRLGSGSSSTIRVNGDLTIGDGATALVASTSTHAPTIAVRGTLTVSAAATLSA